MSGEEGACSESGIGNMSLKFHVNHCQGLVLADNRTAASWRTRLQGNQKIAFSERPILRNEKVYIRVMGNSIVYENGPEAQRKATFGFTVFDPAKLHTVEGQIELHDSLDTMSCTTVENLRKGAVYSFWLDKDGKLNRGSDANNKNAVAHNNVRVKTDVPVWFMVKTKGNVTLKFVDSDLLYMIAGEHGAGNVPVTYIYPDLTNAFAHIMQASKRNEDGRSNKRMIQIGPVSPISDDSVTSLDDAPEETDSHYTREGMNIVLLKSSLSSES